MTTTINADNITFEKNNVVVTLATFGDEENLTKTLLVITPPTSTNQRETSASASEYGDFNTLLIDILGKFEDRITIDGWLITGLNPPSTYGGIDTHSSAEDKKTDLKNMFKAGGGINMHYEGVTFNINMDKLSIKRELTDNNASDGVFGEFTVKLTTVRGEDAI